MYLVSYGTYNGYYEETFMTYEEAQQFILDNQDECSGMGVECIDDPDDDSYYVSR